MCYCNSVIACTHAHCRSPDGQQGGFLREWLNSHLEAAEAIGKPLLFEEFGKRLDNANADTISRLRDPVYTATYDAVQQALEARRPLLGSLFWKWSVPGLFGGPSAERRSAAPLDMPDPTCYGHS